jgi:hypothetical protein
MPNDTELLDALRMEFNQHVAFRERRPGIVQVLAPLFHEDGDMVDIYLDLPKRSDDPIKISDHGMTLMRLSYSYDVDTPTKKKILQRILSENGVSEIDGRLSIETAPTGIYPALLQFAQTVAKVSNMKAFKREVVQSLFYETLNDFVSSALVRFRPERNYVPIPTRDDLDVDWRFPAKRDIFLYGVKDAAKARLAVLSCLEFQKNNVPFRSVIIHDDFENGLSKKDRKRITNVADKQFATIDDFKQDAEEYFDRELASAA